MTKLLPLLMEKISVSLLESEHLNTEKSYVNKNTTSEFKIQLMHCEPIYYSNGYAKGCTSFEIVALHDNVDYLDKLTFLNSSGSVYTDSPDDSYFVNRDKNGYVSIKLRKALNKGQVKKITVPYGFFQVRSQDTYYHSVEIRYETEVLKMDCTLPDPKGEITQAQVSEYPDMESYKRGCPRTPKGTVNFDYKNKNFCLRYPKPQMGSVIKIDWSNSKLLIKRIIRALIT